jgi:hypothetical protein
MRKLFKFYFNCGRMGKLDGLFIAYQEEIDELIGKNVYFGEVLGKHSEITGIIEKEEIKEISNDQELINKLEELFGSDTLCGINPLYCDPQDD